jgi:hypothetical protein
VALRSEDTVATERQLGFTHSHNDAADVLDAVGVDGETRVRQAGAGVQGETSRPG